MAAPMVLVLVACPLGWTLCHVVRLVRWVMAGAAAAEAMDAFSPIVDRKGMAHFRIRGMWARFQVADGMARVTFNVATDRARIPLAPAGMTLHVFPGSVAAAMPSPVSARPLQQFVRRAAGIAASVAAVQILKSNVGRGVCLICGVLVSDGVSCPTCATPHHADCWAYAGGCCIYGCTKAKSA